MDITRELRPFLTITGVVLAVIGVVHLVLGINLSLISGDTRFGGGILIGAGLTWIYGARRTQIPVTLIWILADPLGLGALGRITSMFLVGVPGALATTQTIIESMAALATATPGSRHQPRSRVKFARRILELSQETIVTRTGSLLESIPFWSLRGDLRHLRDVEVAVTIEMDVSVDDRREASPA